MNNKSRRPRNILSIILVIVAMISFCVGAASCKEKDESLSNSFIKSCQLIDCEIDEKYSDSANGKGILFTPNNVGSAFEFQNTTFGIFQAEMYFLDVNDSQNISEYKWTFSTPENDSLAIVIQLRGKEGDVYAEYNGVKCGIFYKDNKQVLMTAEQNANGSFTSVDLSKKINLSFNPNSKQVKVNDVLVWDFSKFSNDEHNIQTYIDSFADYKVKFELLSKEKGSGKVCFYSIFGCDLSALNPIENAKPSLYVDVKFNALVGESFKIPMPKAKDIMDKAIAKEDISVSIVKDSGEVFLSQNYKDDLAFVFNEAGAYSLMYEVEDKNGNSLSQVFKILALNNVDVSYSVSKRIEQGVFGLNTEILIPVCFVEDSLFRADVQRIAQGKIMHGTEVVSEFIADKEWKYSFTNAGDYTIQFSMQGLDETASYKISIDPSLPTLSFVYYNENYETGTLLALQQASITYGGQTKSAECIISTPNGSAFGGDAYELSQTGEYVISYTAVFDDKPIVFKKIINVNYSVADVLTDNPRYSAKMGYHPLDKNFSGLIITSSPRTNVSFSAPINFNALDENDNFIELVAIANGMGQMDYNQFQIILTDTEDASNQLYITCYSASNLKRTYVSIATNEYEPSLFIHDKTNRVAEVYIPFVARYEDLVHENLGTTVNHSFANQQETILEGVDDIELKLRFDHKNLRLYAYAGDDAPKLVADLKDISFIRQWDRKFEGFKNGTAYCSVSYDHRKVKTLNWDDSNPPEYVASFMVTEFGGYDYTSGTVIDSKLPVIEVNKSKEPAMAVVGKEFKIFDAIAFDNSSANLPIDVSVFFNYKQPSQTWIQATNGKFIPSVEGPFTIVYSTMDLFGNVAYETREVFAKKESDIHPISISIHNHSAEYLTGQIVEIPNYDIYGGVGNYSVAIEVKIGEDIIPTFSLNGRQVFLAERQGEYNIKFIVKDYIGTEKIDGSLMITVNKNSIPQFENQPNMPMVLTAGTENALPIVRAKDYAVYPSEDLEVKVLVKYPNEANFIEIEDQARFNPDKEKITTGDKLTIRYVAEGANGSNYIDREIYVADFNSENGKIDLENYFICENASLEVKKPEGESTYGLYANFAQGESTIIYGKKLIEKGLSFNFNIGDIANAKDTDKIEFLLSDSFEGTQQIKVTLLVKKAQFYVNDNSADLYKADVDKGNIILTYNSDLRKVNLTKSTEDGMIVLKTLNGQIFDGFNSSFVNLSIKVMFESAINNAQIKAINGQNLSFNDEGKGTDRGVPVIVTEKVYGGSAFVGSEYTIPKAVAGDLLSFIDENGITVSVRDKKGYVKAIDGTELKDAPANKEYKILLSSVGEIIIKYNCQDQNKVKAATNDVKLYVFENMEEKEVSLTINGAIPENAKLGSSFLIPTATAENGITVLFSLLGPDNERIEYLDGAVVFNRQGKYTFTYTALDEKGNMKIYNYYVMVK